MTKRRPLALGAAAALGLGSLFIAAPAMAEDPSANADTQASTTELSAAPIQAAEAQSIQDAAAATGSTPGAIQQQLDAGEILVSAGGGVARLDKWDFSNVEKFSVEGKAASIPGTPAGGSKPGASVTVYLDFDGDVVEGKGWNTENPKTASYTFAGSSIDQQRVWATVAEDYAPFDVNVTTTKPSDDALIKSSASDTKYGVHMVISDSDVPAFAAGSAGIAYLGSAGSDYLSPAFVWTPATASNGNPIPEVVGMAAAHEVGHTLGLDHDGFGSEEYYNPDGGIWGPIMGAPYNSPLVQWSKGDYANATNTQDDLSVMTDHSQAQSVFFGWQYSSGEYFEGGQVCTDGSVDPNNPNPGDVIYTVNAGGTCDPVGEKLTAHFDYRDRASFAADDHGNDAAGATALDNADGSFSDTGVIGRTGEKDVFKVTTAGGPLTASVAVAEISPDLDTKLTLTDAKGTELASNAPEATLNGTTLNGLDSTVTADVAKGTYYLTVTGVGQGDPASATQAAANGYSNYGSLGNYTLSGTAAAPAVDPLAAPVVSAPADESTTNAKPTFSGTGAAGADLTVTVVDASGNKFTVTTKVGADGKWTATLPDALAEGKYTVSATQSLDGQTSPASATVDFTVDVPDTGADANGTDADANGADADANGANADANGANADANGANADANGTDADANGADANGSNADANAADAGSNGTDANGTTGANGTAGADSATATAKGSGDGDLPVTGGDYGFASTLGFITLALLLSGGVIAAVAIRQRKQQEEMIG